MFDYKIILLIGAGGFLGSVSRYILSQFVQNKILSAFPYGTMAVNLIGSFLIGVVFALVEKGNISPEYRLFIATGILGGFTTFSAFSLDTLTLIQEGVYLETILYILITLIGGIALAFFGNLIIKTF